MANGVMPMHSTCEDVAANTTATAASSGRSGHSRLRNAGQGRQGHRHQHGVDDRGVEDLAQHAPDGRVDGQVGRDPRHVAGHGQAERRLQRPRQRAPLRRDGRQNAAAGDDLGIEGGHDLVMRYRRVARDVARPQRDDERRHHDRHDDVVGRPARQVLGPLPPGSRQRHGCQRQQQRAHRNEHRHVVRLHQHVRQRIGRRELELLQRRAQPGSPSAVAPSQRRRRMRRTAGHVGIVTGADAHGRCPSPSAAPTSRIVTSRRFGNRRSNMPER